MFSLYYYSFDFFCKSLFAVMFLAAAAVGWKMPSMLLNFFYPLALVYLIFALRRAYQQKWTLTLIKAVVLFACETLIFAAVNIGGFFVAFSTV